MTHPSRLLAATLMCTLVLSTFAAGFLPARADDAAPSSDASATAVSADTGAGIGDTTDVETDSQAPETTPTVDGTGTALEQSDSYDTAGDSTSVSDTTSSADTSVTGTSSPADPADTSAPETDAGSSAPVEDTADGSTLPSADAVLTGTSTASSTVTDGTISNATTTSSTATTTGPTISTGDSVALANILNIANTNLVNSTGNVLLLNYTSPVTDAIDLRTGTPVFATTSGLCALIACAGTGGVSVNLASNASLQNAIVLSATSGGNVIDTGSTTTDSSSTASILTGDAFAGLNLINIANTNIIDSNYLLVAMNAFKGVAGDIIFPSLSNFLSLLSNSLSAGYVSVTNDGSVTNNVATDAESGGNTVENASSSVVSSGVANSTASVFNQMNTTMFGGSNVAILFRLQGAWNGQVYGAPAGMTLSQGPDGMLALVLTPDSSTQSPFNASLTQLTASSTARITNDVDVAALTGANQIKNAASALISSGDALASANVLNVANTNVVGKNWIMGIVNIFGDFTGNISFGRPDLWVGEQIAVPSKVEDGTQVTYTYTVMNKGDADASNVVLSDAYDQAHVTPSDSSVPFAPNGGTLTWNLGTLPAGGTATVTYQGTVQGTEPGTTIANTVHVTGYEPDNNPADNSDSASFMAGGDAQSGNFFILSDINSPLVTVASTSATTTQTAHLTVTRDQPHTTSSGSSVHQVVTVANDSGASAIPVIAHDVLTAPDGAQIYDESWDIGSLVAGDAVQLAYDASFGENAPAGTYTLTTILTDEDGDVLGQFSNNGTIELTPPQTAIKLNSSGSAVAKPMHSTVKHLETTSSRGSVLGAVFPGAAVAHAADGNQAAAAGLVPISWPYAVGGALVLLGLLVLLSWYRERQG